MPRAVDSITQEAPRSLYASRVNSSATLPGKEALLGPRGAENQIHRDKDDGLAAILAAKIRTKAELKQVNERTILGFFLFGGLAPMGGLLMYDVLFLVFVLEGGNRPIRNETDDCALPGCVVNSER